jgi:predicted PurR-regulated permease PerM
MSDNTHTTVNISTVTILKVLFAILLVWFLFSIKEIVLLFLISVIISSAIDPLADYLQKKRIPRAISVILVYIVVLGIFGTIIALLVPPLTQQFAQIAQSDYVAAINNRVGDLRTTLTDLGVGQQIQDNIKNIAGSISSGLFKTTQGVVTGAVSIITVLVVSFYLTIEENGLKNFVKHLAPFKHQAYANALINKIQKKMGAWVLGQVILSLIIFSLTYLGLTILNVKFALVLALIAGVLELIPYLGPFLAGIPAVFFAFLQNPPLAIAVLVLYIIIQELENHVIVPVVMSKSVGLNPVLVILGILIGGSLGGIVGAVIAVPLLAGVSVFITSMTGMEGEMPDIKKT